VNEYLKISLLQIDLFHKDKKKNLSNIDNLVCDMENTDIILLPEMFNTSFCPFDISLAEDTNGETVAWMKSLSKKKSCAVAGTLMIREKNKIYNRLIWISKDGSLHSYDKRHLFSLIKEQKTISKGDKRNIIIEEG
jgi:predicted amidohydrolase